LTDVLVIAGPAGVGKTSTANEVSQQLRAAGVKHAVVDTDALDDVYPIPAEQWRTTERNLAAVWRTYTELGIDRLIITGVHVHRDAELAWIKRATAAQTLTLVRLTACDATLMERVRKREIGSRLESQLRRTLEQTRRLDAEGGGEAHVIDTDGLSVAATAARIAGLAGWL
jgi:cytidylate kinase